MTEFQYFESDVPINYIWRMPCKWTFEIEPIYRFLQKYAYGKVLNAFAGKTRLSWLDEYRIDSNDEFKPDYLLNSIYLDEIGFKKKSFDGAILDPPFSARQANDLYKGHKVNRLWLVKYKVAPLIKDGGFVISCGFDSNGMGKKLGFAKKQILLVCHGGNHNDTIVLLEKKRKGLTEAFC